MSHLISNLYEKNYIPFTPKFDPSDLGNIPPLGKYLLLSTRISVLKTHHIIEDFHPFSDFTTLSGFYNTR